MKTSCCILIWTAALLQAQSIDDVMGVNEISAVEISPDATRVAYAVAHADPAHNRTVSAIWVADAGGGRNQQVVDGLAPSWSPDGKRIAFICDRSGSMQVWSISAAGGGEAEQLSRLATPVMKFRWAPDGSHIALLSMDPPTRDKVAPVVIDVTDLRMYRLWALDLSTKESKLLTPGPYSAGGYDQWFPDCFSWSPDSRAIAFSRRPNAKVGSHLYGDVFTVGLDGADPKPVVEREGMDGNPEWSPRGNQIGFISTGVYDWVRISNLYVVSRDSKYIRNLSHAFDESVREFQWTDDERSIHFIAGQGVAMQIFELDVGTAALRPLTEGSVVYSHLSVSRDGARCAFVRQSAHEPPDVYVSPLPVIKPKRLSQINPQAANWHLGETEIIRWKSYDGMEIEGIVHKPAGYQMGQRYPLLVIPHGGPSGVMTNDFPALDALFFPAHGWVVFCPNFRGSRNYGERFLRADLHGYGLGDFRDVMAGVDRLIDDGLVDKDRMAMAGASYGGYMTAWTISQTNRFKAAVVGCAITDLPSFVRTADVPERWEGYLGTDPLAYPAQSPMFYGEHIKTPALIWHGDQDPRVPPIQSRHLYTQLKKNKVPVELVMYPGEGHGVRQPAHEKDLLEREAGWLERWVSK